MKSRGLGGSIALHTVVWVAAGCVPAGAGYDDVRTLTSERLGKEVRWHEQSSRRRSDADTKKLLESPLTPDSVVQIALFNNEALQAAFEELGIARGRLMHAFRLPNPSASVALRYGSAARPELDVDATLSLSELLFMPWRQGVAGAALDASKLEVETRVVDLAFDTRAAFFDYQAAQQQLGLRKSVLEALRASVDMAERLHEAGNITDLSLANERSFYEEARISSARAEAMLSAEREKLNALMGLWGPSGAGWTAPATLPDPAPAGPLVADVERRAVEKSLDLQLSRRRFEEAARRTNLSRLEGWVPDLKAGVSAEHHDGNWGVGPLAEIEVPLFYQGQGQTVVALSEMRRERKLFADTAVRLRARVRAVASQLGAAADGVQYYRSTLLPLREQIIAQTQLEYNAMGVGAFQLLQAKRDQIAAAQGYVNLLHDYWTQRNELERLLAGRLSSGAGPVEGLATSAASPRGEPGGH